MEVQNPTPAGYSVAFIFADSQREWNVSQWRSLTVSDALNRAGGSWSGRCLHFTGFSSYLDSAIQDKVLPCDLIIFSRNALIPQSHDAMVYYQGLGKPVVMDLDDAYFMLPWSNPARPFWNELEFQSYDGKEKGGGLRMLEEALRLSDGLIAPNRMLLKMYEPLSGNSYYLQNYAETQWWTDLPDREEDDRIIIGWGGSLSHWDSWLGSGIIEAAERISKRPSNSNVWWKICGGDQKVYDSLPIYQKMHQPGVAPSDWPKIVRTFDIGVAPLHGLYDEFRSWIKGIEYALAGVPAVGTEGPTYNDLEDWMTLGPEQTRFWEHAIEEKLKNLKRFKDEAESRREEARQAFLVDNNIDVFGRVYGQIIEDFKDDRAQLPGVIHLEKRADTGEEHQDSEPVGESAAVN